MKVSELIEFLKEMPPDLQVYAHSDHSQEPEKCNHPQIMYVDELTHNIQDGMWATDKDDARKLGIKKKAVLL